MDESWIEFDHNEFSKRIIRTMARGIVKILPDSVRPRQRTSIDTKLGRVYFFVFFDHGGTEKSVYVSIKDLGDKTYITSAIFRSYGPSYKEGTTIKRLKDMLPEKDGPIGTAELGKFFSAYILEYT